MSLQNLPAVDRHTFSKHCHMSVPSIKLALCAIPKIIKTYNSVQYNLLCGIFLLYCLLKVIILASILEYRIKPEMVAPNRNHHHQLYSHFFLVNGKSGPAQPGNNS